MGKPGSFVICAKKVNDDWAIDSWKDSYTEAERIATQLTVKPYMAQIAAVFEVGGSDALPEFTLKFQAKGQA